MPFLPIVITSDPELAVAILEDTEQFPAKGLGLSEARYYLGDGRLTATTDSWIQTHRATRAIYHPQAFGKSAGAVVSNLEARLLTQDISSPVALQPLVEAAIMQSLLLPLLGADISAREPIDLLITDIKCLTQWSSRRLSIPSAFVSSLSWITSTDARDARSRLRDKIREWEAAAPDGTLKALAGAGAASLEDEVVTLLLAGFETTAATVGFAIDETARSPGWARRIADAPDPMSTARKIVLEALRLHPPVWAITRRAKKDACVGGWLLSAGEDVLIDVHGLHRDADDWKDPDLFDPERFSSRSQLPASYMPFGAGPRQCVGRRLGLDEAEAIIAWLFSSYYVSALQPRLPVQAGLAQRPAGLSAYQLEPRSRAHG